MNIACASRLGLRTIHINEQCNLHTALLKYLGVLDSHWSFNQVEYLQAKNQLDKLSKSKATESKVSEMLLQRISSSNQTMLTIVDLGAGNESDNIRTR